MPAYAVAPAITAKIKADYIKGLGSIREIASSYACGDDNQVSTLEHRAVKAQWKKQRDIYLQSITAKDVKQAQNRALEWQNDVFEDSKHDFKAASSLVRSQIDQGLLTGESLGAIARAKRTYDDMARRALGLSDPVQSHQVEMSGQPMQSFILNVLQIINEGVKDGRITGKDIPLDAMDGALEEG